MAHVPSITEYLEEVYARGTTAIVCSLRRDPQTEVLLLTMREAEPTSVPEPQIRTFAANGDQLLPRDGIQTFSEAIMRSGMTTEQKLHWLLLTVQEYEQKYTLVSEKREEEKALAPSCASLALWEIGIGTAYDQTTYACTAHVGCLLTDASSHWIARLPHGTELRCCFVRLSREEESAHGHV